MKKFKKMLKKNKELVIIIAINIVLILLAILLKNTIVKILLGSLVILFDIVMIFKKLRKKSKKKKTSILKVFLLFMFSIVIFCFIALFGFLGWVILDSPEFKTDNLYSKEVSIVYDNSGKIIAKLGVEKREKISFDELPEVLVDAIIATEDSRFFQHNGFDLPRFAVASIKQMLGQNAGGASTITMQVSKNAFTDTTSKGLAGIKRKFTDIYMAIFKIEKTYTKEEIIEFYVNSYLMGGRIYGVEQACQTYFGKSAKDINLSEAAIIAGLYQSPNKYSPVANPENATQRRNTVLTLMVRHGYISEEEKQIAAAIPIKTLTEKGNKLVLEEYQDFIDTVVEDVKDTTGNDPYSVAMEIYTTMNPKIQKEVNKIMRGETFKWENKGVDGGVAVVDSENGAIVAVGGGRNRDVAGFNNATQMKKQIGSTAKPLFDYGPGIEYENWSTYTPWTDEPITYTGTTTVVSNWDGGYVGFITSRDALRISRNIPALKSFKKQNKANILEFVKNLGLSPETDGFSLHEAHAIGGYDGESPLSLAAAYAAFANGGYYRKPYSFTKIVYRESGDVYDHKVKAVQAMSDATAFMVNNILEDTSIYNLGSNTINGVKFASKTGTTNYPKSIQKKYRLSSGAVNDLWLVGMNANYSLAVWYGYDKIDEEYARNGYYSKLGNSYHKALFRAVAKHVFTEKSTINRPSSVSVVTVEHGCITDCLASEFTPAGLIRKELYKKGTEPTETSPLYSKLDNIENLVSSYSSGVVTLSWDPVEKTNLIDIKYWENLSKKIYTNESHRLSYVNGKKNYIAKSIGDMAYAVYKKNADGSLDLINTTTDNRISINVSSTANSITYVVKTTYKIYKACASDGKEVIVSFGNTSPIIISVLNGADDNGKTTIALNSSYIESGVNVYENMFDVTNNSGVSITTVYKNQNGDIVTSINTSTARQYTATYTIKYKEYSEVLTRYITIK